MDLFPRELLYGNLSISNFAPLPGTLVTIRLGVGFRLGFSFCIFIFSCGSRYMYISTGSNKGKGLSIQELLELERMNR